MMRKQHTSSRQPLILLLGVGVVLSACLLAVLTWSLRPADGTTQSATADAARARVNLTDPAESYETFLHVLHNGGCSLTQAAAIGWLDRHSRDRRALSSAEAEMVMSMTRADGHSSWDAGYRQHLYNSAFNALHHSQDPAPLTHILHHLALHDHDRVMRLYALQHIGIQRYSGRLDGALADEIHATLTNLAGNPESEISGTAIELLAHWLGRDTPAEPQIQALAAATAADRSRPVDIRVASIHAAGPASLEVSRIIAPDTTEPVILRKAAIARIGHHGGEADLTTLSTLNSESTRIAQATKPARAEIIDRLENPSRPALIPYVISSTD